MIAHFVEFSVCIQWPYSLCDCSCTASPSRLDFKRLYPLQQSFFSFQLNVSEITLKIRPNLSALFIITSSTFLCTEIPWASSPVPRECYPENTTTRFRVPLKTFIEGYKSSIRHPLIITREVCPKIRWTVWRQTHPSSTLLQLTSTIPRRRWWCLHYPPSLPSFRMWLHTLKILRSSIPISMSLPPRIKEF